jgi:transposase
MNAYSKDLRLKTLAALDRGLTRGEVVETFGISLATLKRWLKGRREGSDLSPRHSTGPLHGAQAAHRGHTRTEGRPTRAAPRERHRHPQAPLRVVGAEDRGRGLGGDHESRDPPEAGVEQKKRTLAAAERDEGKRRAWRETLSGVDPARLVFVEESSTNISLAPRYARVPKGERARGKVPKNWGKNVTLIASMSEEGMGPSMSIEGSSDTESFGLYMKDILAPRLEEGQIVIMDNLSVHKSAWVRELIEGRGCSLVLLPSYSPDFDPIEQAFSKLKDLLRKAEARTREALFEATHHALRAITQQDARSYFEYCGYTIPRAQSI